MSKYLSDSDSQIASEILAQSKAHKPRVLVAVLTGVERQNWINPELSVNLIAMARDSRFDVCYYPARDCRPWEAARNMTIQAARQINADWLLSFDNDNFVRGNPLDIIAAAGAEQDVIGLTYGVGNTESYHLYPTPDVRGKISGQFQEVEAVAGGVLAVRSTVWQRIPKGPWFRWQHAENETLAPDRGVCGEDMWFCRLVRQHGFKVWTHHEVMAGHYRTTDLTGMVCTMAQMSKL